MLSVSTVSEHLKSIQNTSFYLFIFLVLNSYLMLYVSYILYVGVLKKNNAFVQVIQCYALKIYRIPQGLHWVVGVYIQHFTFNLAIEMLIALLIYRATKFNLLSNSVCGFFPFICSCNNHKREVTEYSIYLRSAKPYDPGRRYYNGGVCS